MSDFSNAERCAGSIVYEPYQDERQLREISVLVAGELSEPYSVFTYRYFLVQWPELCICAYDCSIESKPLIGAIICKVEAEADGLKKGYIGMLVVDKKYRGSGIGSELVKSGIRKMVAAGSDEIFLETEASNVGALNLYERLGFAREEKMAKYYLNGDAFRLKLWLDLPSTEVDNVTKKIEQVEVS